MADYNKYGVSVDPQIEEYEASNFPETLELLDGDAFQEYKLMDNKIRRATISPSIASTRGAKGFKGHGTNVFGRPLVQVKEVQAEITQLKPIATGNDIDSGRNLVKIEEVIWHRLMTTVTVMGLGADPEDFDIDTAGSKTTKEYVIQPLIGSKTITIPIGATWGYRDAEHMRDLCDWAIVFKYYTPGTSPYSANIITPSADWTSFIALLHAGAKASYQMERTMYANDYMDETLIMIEHRMDDDEAA